MGGLHTVLVAILTLALPALPAQAPARQPFAGGAAQSRQGDPLQEAEALLQAQQYAQAEEKLQALMPAQSKNPQAWFDLGFSQSHQGKAQQAVTAYQKAVELAPDWFEANLNLGLDLAKTGNKQAAIKVLKHAVELKPSQGGERAVGRAWLSLAQAMEDEGSDPRAATEAYDKAAEFNPADVQLSTRAGMLLEKAGDTAGAEQRYRKAAAAGDAAAMARLINLLSLQKRYAEAETWLRQYAAQNPKNLAASMRLGKLLAAEGKTQDAIAVLKPLSGPAASPDVNRTLAELYLDNKQYAEAAPLLQQERDNNDGDAQLRADLGRALLYQLKYAEAEAELLNAIKLKPDLADAYGYLAEAARQNQHYELCLRALDARAHFLPETPGTYFLRATSYDSLRMYKPAVANYKLFLEAAAGKYPDQEFQARHRLKAIEPK